MWIFGYGSIIWKPGFEYVDRQVGFIRGWKRCFYQGSFDHRGEPGRPGRVVTLLPAEDAHCWGMAYRIEGGEAERVLSELDHREKGGYQRFSEPVFGRLECGTMEPVVSEALVYVAEEGNPNYLGAASIEVIAHQILGAHGPSGSNVDYLLRLAQALREWGLDDDHVFALEKALAELMG
ncbi:MAG: gamma-glutamylcyclotransferase [Bradymonadaceae bacterium]